MKRGRVSESGSKHVGSGRHCACSYMQDRQYFMGLIQIHSRKRRAAKRTDLVTIPYTSEVVVESEAISVQILFYADTKVYVTDVVVKSNSAQLEQVKPAITPSYGKLRN